jgi:class 3 adenylate cyclase
MAETRKIAAILAADVVGYSRLTGTDEDRTLARLRALRSDLIDPTIAVHHGRVVKRTGDGALVEFRSVVDAVRCAIEVQNGMVERNAGLPAERRIEFRIGVHLGDVVEESDGDLMGDSVNIAARLEGIAKPGAICLSEDAYRQVKARLDLAISDLGATQLKNIVEPIRVYSIEVGVSAQQKSQAESMPLKHAERPALPDKPSIEVLPFQNMSGALGTKAIRPSWLIGLLGGLALVTVAGFILLRSAQSPLLQTLTGHSADADSIAFTPDGKRIAAGSWDTSILVWNTMGGAPVLTIKDFSGHAAPFSPDGKSIAGGSGDSDVAIWDSETGRRIHVFSQHTKKVQVVAFSPDGTQLVSGGEDAMVYLWAIGGERPPRPFAGHTDKVFAAAFAPDGKHFVSAGFDGNVIVWDIARGQAAYPPLTSNHSKILAAAFSPDGGSIVTGGWDFNVHVWDADTGQHLRAYPGSAMVDAVAYSPDGKLIAAGYGDGSVSIWDSQTVRRVAVLTGHLGPVWGIGFSSDGKIVGSASADKTVKTWKTP